MCIVHANNVYGCVTKWMNLNVPYSNVSIKDWKHFYYFHENTMVDEYNLYILGVCYYPQQIILSYKANGSWTYFRTTATLLTDSNK